MSDEEREIVMLRHVYIYLCALNISVGQQFGEGPHIGVLVKCPHTFGYIVDHIAWPCTGFVYGR